MNLVCLTRSSKTLSHSKNQFETEIVLLRLFYDRTNDTIEKEIPKVISFVVFLWGNQLLEKVIVFHF